MTHGLTVAYLLLLVLALPLCTLYTVRHPVKMALVVVGVLVAVYVMVRHGTDRHLAKMAKRAPRQMPRPHVYDPEKDDDLGAPIRTDKSDVIEAQWRRVKAALQREGYTEAEAEAMRKELSY